MIIFNRTSISVILFSLLLYTGCKKEGDNINADAKKLKSIHSYGVLLADPSHMTTDYNAGVRWAEIEADWTSFEPSHGAFNTSALPIAEIKQYKQAGWKVEFSFGLHNPPAWACDIEPWKDQKGETYRQEANWFNANIQAEVATVITKIIQAIGASNIDAIRIGGLHEAGEMMYPSDVPNYRYLAFSASATNGTSLIPKRSVRSWKPGNASPNGEAATFYIWYIKALATFGNYQVNCVRDAGYQGDVQWLMPGHGVTPEFEQALIENNLVLDFDDYSVCGGGANWPRIISEMIKDCHTIISMTGINDDSSIQPNENSSNPDDWSAAHWIAYNADQYGLRKSAESVGDDEHRTKTAMQRAFAKLIEFDYERLMWTHDYSLYTPGLASIEDYEALIRANP